MKPVKNYCNHCQSETNHSIIATKTIAMADPDYSLDWKHFMLECLGCESISFRVETHDYEASYPDEYDNWTHDISVRIYPFPLKNHRPIKEIYLLPSEIRTVYDESVEALKSSCFLLAGVGFRAVIEAVCIDKKIIGRTLEAKINNLLKNRLIADKEAERLHAVRFLGNDSVHEMAVPKEQALYVVLDIIEHLLKNLYLIDKSAKTVLDTYITEMKEFEQLLFKELKKFNVNDDFPLAKYIGKDVRRLNGQISQFETALIDRINKGEFKLLSIGNVKVFGTNATHQFQHFIKT